MTEVKAWSPREATSEIRSIAQSKNLTISYKRHAVERLDERSLIISDVLYVLKHGFVYLEPTPATRAGFNKYAMENKSPNGGSREVRVVVIPDKKSCFLKIISVMWVDEKETVTGSIVGEKDA